MPHLVVCSLFHLEATAEIYSAREMITLLSPETPFERPPSIDPARHLMLNMNDIRAPAVGLTAPQEPHIERLIDFAGGWDRSLPLLIHCWMGISRSTAAAYITALALNPARDEEELALDLRRRAPSATPNARMIALADGLLGRRGRMVAAIERIGRGAEAARGVPFELPLEAG